MATDSSCAISARSDGEAMDGCIDNTGASLGRELVLEAMEKQWVNASMTKVGLRLSLERDQGLLFYRFTNDHLICLSFEHGESKFSSCTKCNSKAITFSFPTSAVYGFSLEDAVVDALLFLEFVKDYQFMDNVQLS
ncbi:hypothetical protein AVEN_126907-1 [Araneus ventricosus]|uniref:Uncharacterized protein n=1 Tax=Araneus ventricosus TaxID=182803 RepID=A0A4Y2C0K9_ARAVE|nr:hypothetical protein AVEN_126907-1 [Araneus ventricosus]